MIRENYWTKLLAIIGNFCFSRHPQVSRAKSLFLLHLVEEHDEQGAEDAGGEGAEQDGYLAGGSEHVGGFGGEFAEGEGVDEDGHGEADAAEAGYGEEHFPGGSFGHGANFALDGDEGGEGDADGFSEEESEEDAHADESYAFEWEGLENVEEADIRNNYTCIRKCKDWHDAEVDPRIEFVLKTITHSDGVIANVAETTQTVTLIRIREILLITYRHWCCQFVLVLDKTSVEV